MATSVPWRSSLVLMFVVLVIFSFPCETEERVLATKKDSRERAEQRFPLDDEVCGRSLSHTPKFFPRKGSHPWMAALFDEDEFTDGPFCGGSLIHRRYVLTAARCLLNRNATKIIVSLGVSDWARDSRRRQDYSVEEIIVHEGFSNSTFENDIALLRLTETVELEEHINLICLPKANFQGQTAKFSGWGHAKYYGHSKLRELDLEVIPNAECEELITSTDSFSSGLCFTQNEEIEASQDDSETPHDDVEASKEDSETSHDDVESSRDGSETSDNDVESDQEDSDIPDDDGEPSRDDSETSDDDVESSETVSDTPNDDDESSETFSHIPDDDGEPGLTESEICAGTVPGECMYLEDNGSPLSSQVRGRTTLIGVASWGKDGDSSLSVFVRVFDYLDWLEEKLEY